MIVRPCPALLLCAVAPPWCPVLRTTHHTEAPKLKTTQVQQVLSVSVLWSTRKRVENGVYMQRRGVSRGCRGASRCRESSHARRSHYVVPVARGLGSVEGRRGVSRGGVEGVSRLCRGQGSIGLRIWGSRTCSAIVLPSRAWLDWRFGD